MYFPHYGFYSIRFFGFAICFSILRVTEWGEWKLIQKSLSWPKLGLALSNFFSSNKGLKIASIIFTVDFFFVFTGGCLKVQGGHDVIILICCFITQAQKKLTGWLNLKSLEMRECKLPKLDYTVGIFLNKRKKKIVFLVKLN